MKKLEIPVKFSREDIVFTIKKIKPEVNCSICEGKGTIKYNDKDMKCPECMGKGKFTSDKQINAVCDKPYIISTIKISVNNSGGITVRYKGCCGITPLNRGEENLFSTKEEAQARCDELNKEKTFISISDIIIPDIFKETQPSIDKIQTKLEYYKANNKFEKDIVIGKERVLKDGYINYLICKLLNIDFVKVTVENAT